MRICGSTWSPSAGRPDGVPRALVRDAPGLTHHHCAENPAL
ncbi:hypothetical protein QJS66_02290 [Kocuria rhizophila]|nr:hypothetical protein QJS66_02290 [Kocuria rhizophila]